MPSTGLSAYNFPHLSPGIPIKHYPHATDQETEINGDENPHFRSQAEWQMQDSNPHAPNSKAHVPRSRQQTKDNHSQLSPRIHSQATSARCGVVSGNQTDKGPAVTELTCSVPSPDPLLPAWEERKDSVHKGLHQAQTGHPNRRYTASGRDNTRCPVHREPLFGVK